MSTPYIVEPGDCLCSIAKGFNFDDWKVIYTHADNGDFRQLRPNPNVIFPGDTLYIPDFDSGSQSASTETTNNYVVQVAKTMLRVIIQDTADKPYAGCKYKLEIPGLPTINDTTAGNGLISQEIPADATQGDLTVYHNGGTAPPLLWRLQLGNLDPAEEVSGQQGRLANLGFDPGDVNGLSNSDTDNAMARFQTKYGITPADGKPSQATLDKLKELHGS